MIDIIIVVIIIDILALAWFLNEVKKCNTKR